MTVEKNDDAKYQLETFSCRRFLYQQGNIITTTEWNSTDPIKYRFHFVEMEWYLLGLLHALRLSLRMLLRTAWSHYNFAIWLKIDGRFQKKDHHLELNRLKCKKGLTAHNLSFFCVPSQGSSTESFGECGCMCLHECVIYDYFQSYWSWTNIQSKNCQ